MLWRLGEDACHGARGDDARTGLRPCQQLLIHVMAENGTPGLESKAWYTVTGRLLVFPLLRTSQVGVRRGGT